LLTLLHTCLTACALISLLSAPATTLGRKAAFATSFPGFFGGELMSVTTHMRRLPPFASRRAGFFRSELMRSSLLVRSLSTLGRYLSLLSRVHRGEPSIGAAARTSGVLSCHKNLHDFAQHCNFAWISIAGALPIERVTRLRIGVVTARVAVIVVIVVCEVVAVGQSATLCCQPTFAARCTRFLGCELMTGTFGVRSFAAFGCDLSLLLLIHWSKSAVAAWFWIPLGWHISTPVFWEIFLEQQIETLYSWLASAVPHR
jgi:hypothetical protein